MNFAINCSDDPSTSPDEFKEEGVLPMYTAYTLDFARRYMLASCPIMNVPRLPDSSDVPVTEDIPTLVLNGALDPATSASNGDLVASHLPNVKEVTFGNGGHIQLSKPCAQQIIAAFLKDPSAQLDTSCVPASQTFKLPFAGTGTSPDGNVSLTVTLPPDFIQGDPSAAQWQKAAGTPIFAINVDPAGTTALEALQKGLAKLGISPSEADIKDGPEIAGLPSKHYQGTTNLGDKEYALDAFGIENENGAYVILALEGNPALLDYWRTQTLPAILESATVQPASSSSASATASGDGAASQPGATSMTSDGDIQSHAFTVGSTIRYQVAAGDWLVQIARCFGTSYQKVLRANPQISDPGQLRRGMMVSVPDLGSTGPVYGPPCVVFHRVMADDTWNSIASSYNADLHLLKEANPGRLSLRRTLVVPNNSAGATS